MLWVFSLISVLLTAALNPWDCHLAITPNLRVGVWAAFSHHDPSLVFFNEREGPYRGSLITIVGDPNPPVVTRVDWEFPRIYYRHIRSDDAVTWTLMVSLWYPLILFAIGPFVWGVSRWRRSRVNVGLNLEHSRGNA